MLRIVSRWLAVPFLLVVVVAVSARLGDARDLQDFFAVSHSSTHIGKLKADNASISCTIVNSKSTSPCLNAAEPPNGNCGFIGYSCTNSGGTAGSGSGNLSLEVNLNGGLTSRGSGNDTSLAPDCYPLFGGYTATGKRDPFQEVMGFAGVACDPLIGEAAQIIGGWQLLDWALVPSIPDGAIGTFTGTMNVNNGALKLVLKGKTF